MFNTFLRIYYRYLECKYFRVDHLNNSPYLLININCASVVFKELLQMLLYTLLKKMFTFISFYYSKSVYRDISCFLLSVINDYFIINFKISGSASLKSYIWYNLTKWYTVYFEIYNLEKMSKFSIKQVFFLAFSSIGL